MPNLHRSADANFLNRVINHPEVRPWFGNLGSALDLTPVIANPQNLVLENEHGGFAALWCDTALYDCHFIVAPNAEPAAALELAQSGLRQLFASTDCIEAITAVPVAHHHGLLLARTAGFQEAFSRPQAWLLPSGKRCATRHFSMTVARWIARDPELSGSGRTFRCQLERLSVQSYREDETADRFMGACAVMARAGNAGKGVAWYNRLAAIACGYAPMRLVSAELPAIDIAGAVFAIESDNLQLISGGVLDREGGHA